MSRRGAGPATAYVLADCDAVKHLDPDAALEQVRQDQQPLEGAAGTPTTPGSYTFTVIATNGTAPDATLQVTVIVTAPPVVDPPATGSLGSLGWPTPRRSATYSWVNAAFFRSSLSR